MRYRDMEIGRGDRVRIERLLARFGELLLEPWVDRVLDLACAGLVHPGGVRMFAPHRLDNDPRGVFRAAIIDDAGTSEEAQHRTPSRPGQAAGRRWQRPATGAFSVDAYVARSDRRDPVAADDRDQRAPSSAWPDARGCRLPGGRRLRCSAETLTLTLTLLN